MKRFMFCLLVAVMILTIAACSDNNDDKSGCHK